MVRQNCPSNSAIYRLSSDIVLTFLDKSIYLFLIGKKEYDRLIVKIKVYHKNVQVHYVSYIAYEFFFKILFMGSHIF